MTIVVSGVLACHCTLLATGSVRALNSVTLPAAEGTIVGAAFSPDSSRVAILRHVIVPGVTNQRHVMEIIDLKSVQKLAHREILDVQAADLDSHFIAYSSDSRYLILATEGSEVLWILDAVSLQALKRIALHPEAESRRSLGQGHRYFRGVKGLTVSTRGDLFGLLTHDESQDNEVFIGSFSSERIIKRWSLGKGGTATQLGQISLSLGDDGSRTAVSVLPVENKLPKAFNNLHLYDTSTGELVKSIRTDGFVGQIVLIPGENIFTSRIDTPGIFSKKTCIDKWDFNTGTANGHFCDQGRTVNVALAVSPAAGRVVGFASQMHKDIEGYVYAAPGRVDMWDTTSGNLIASSSEISEFVSTLQLSSDGQWVMAGQMLLRLAR
jgi:WD40 repeat protein